MATFTDIEQSFTQAPDRWDKTDSFDGTHEVVLEIVSNGGRDNDIPNIILTANVVIKDEKLVKFKLNDAYNAEDESEAIKLSRVHLKEIENIFKKAKTREFFG